MKLNPFILVRFLAHSLFLSFCLIWTNQVTAQQIEVSVPSAGRNATIYKQSAALLIAESDYSNSSWNKLPNVERELGQVKEALASQGFKVSLIKNVPGRDLFQKINEFISQSFDKDSRVIVYFSGHGATDDKGNGYLVGIDAPSDTDSKFRLYTLPMQVIKALASQSRAKHTLFVFDSCYSGSIFTAKGNEDIRPLVLQQLNRDAVQFLSSGTATQRSPAESVFTPIFIDGITGNADYSRDGIIQAEELGLYLQKEVPKKSNQTPQFGSLQDTGGQIIFVPPLTPVTRAGSINGGQTNQKSDQTDSNDIQLGGPTKLPSTIALPIPTLDQVGKIPASAVEGTPSSVNAAKTKSSFSERYPNLKVYYYRKTADGLNVLNALNKSDIPFSARPAELPENYITDSVGCEVKHTNFMAVKEVALAMIESGIPIKSVYRFSSPDKKANRIQLNSNREFSDKPVLTRKDIESLGQCPVAFHK
jgi:hypothetical protein